METSDKRTFIFSSDIFSDFSTNISLYRVSTLEDIIDQFKHELYEILEQYNLTVLKKKLEERNLHIHSHTIESILTSSDDTIFYICDHETIN